MRKLLVSFLLVAFNGFGASHYFDITNNGAATGASWNNAWTNVAGINWASVNAGDTIFISGGTTVKQYNEAFLFDQEGTLANRFWVRIGQDAGHNGIADFGTNNIGPVSGAYKYWTIDGHRGLSYPHPTNWLQVEQGDWTNNIGFWSHGKVGTTTTASDPSFQFYSEGADFITNRYIRVSDYTNTATGLGTGLDERGIIFNGVMENIAVTNIVFEHILLDNNSGSQFVWTDATNSSYGGVEARFLWIKDCGEDHFEVHGGWTVRDSSIGPVRPSDAHCDFFQVTGGYFKLYNCNIKESGHSYARFQSLASKDPLAPRHNGHIQIYNNIFSEIPEGGPAGGTYNEGIVFVHIDSSIGQGGYVTWTNILIANNTMYGSEINTTQDPDEMARNPFIQWSKGQYVTNGYIKDVRVMNNIIMQKHKGNNFPSTTNTGGVTGAGTWVNYEPFTTNDFILNYNIITGTNTSLVTDPRLVSYLDVSDEIETHTYKFANKTNRPIFTSIALRDFSLNLTDISAINQGSNFSSIFNYDTLNKARNIGGAWDIGAHEHQYPLVIFLSFDNDVAGGNATDDSGNGYTGKRFTLSEYSYPSNRTVSALANTQFRPNATGKGMDFLWHTNNGVYNPTYLDDGAFFGVTNAFNALSNLTEMTVMCWARYQNNNRTDVASPDYSQEANAVLISGGGTANGTKGSWFLGRYNQRINQNNTRFVVQTNEGFSGGTSFGTVGDPVIGYGSGNQVFFEFPDRGFDGNGNTTNWYHYAASFSNSVVRFYFNGVFITNWTIATVTTLRLGGGGRPYDWVGIGVNPHTGTPEFDNESGTDYPNNGWFNGALDQVRIYNRALSWQEIVDIANSEGAEFVDAPTGGGGEGTTIIGTTGKKIQRLRIRR